MGSSDPPRPDSVWPTDRLDPTDTRTALLVAGFWLLVGLLAGLGQMASLELAGQQGTGALAPPLLASVIWIPITLAAIRTAGSYPLRPPFRSGAIAVHLVGAAVAPFVLNTVYMLTTSGLGFRDPASLPLEIEILRASLRWWHVNAGAYLVIVALASLPWGPDASDRGDVEPAADAHLRAEAGGRVHLVPVASIDWIEGAGDYARLHTGGSEYLCSRRLKELERALPAETFVRIHRSTIVNATRIAHLRHLSRGDYRVVLADGVELRASRRRRKELQHTVEGLELERS